MDGFQLAQLINYFIVEQGILFESRLHQKPIGALAWWEEQSSWSGRHKFKYYHNYQKSKKWNLYMPNNSYTLMSFPQFKSIFIIVTIDLIKRSMHTRV